MASNRCKCLLDNGMVRVYHAAGPVDGNMRQYHHEAFSCMGEGVIYSIGGTLLSDQPRLKFYRLRTNRPRWAE